MAATTLHAVLGFEARPHHGVEVERVGVVVGLLGTVQWDAAVHKPEVADADGGEAAGKVGGGVDWGGGGKGGVLQGRRKVAHSTVVSRYKQRIVTWDFRPVLQCRETACIVKEAAQLLVPQGPLLWSQISSRNHGNW